MVTSISPLAVLSSTLSGTKTPKSILPIIGEGQEAYDVRITDLDSDKKQDILVSGRKSMNGLV